jgi:hypothetical protein
MFNAPIPSGKPFKKPPLFKTIVLLIGIAWVVVETIYGNFFFALTGSFLVTLAGIEYVKDARKTDDGDDEPKAKTSG